MPKISYRQGQVVVVLKKPEALVLRAGIRSGYLQNTKQKARILDAIDTALELAGCAPKEMNPPMKPIDPKVAKKIHDRFCPKGANP